MEQFNIPANVLHELLTGASASAAGAKEYRQHLAQIELVVDNNLLRVAGTDGMKLAVGDYTLFTATGSYFKILWHVSEIKSALAWLKPLKDSTVLVAADSLRRGDDSFSFTPTQFSYLDVMAVIPNEFPTPLGDTMPAFIVDPSLLADMAKIPNTAKRVEIKFNHVKHASLAEWANESGVSWRYVFMRKSA